MNNEKLIGQTASAGFQVGVRRIFPLTSERAWDLITSIHGVNIWLGNTSSINFQKGHRFLTDEGISGEIRVVNQFVNIRLSWKKDNWIKPSTLQIRTIPNGNEKTTISLHQENLLDINVREEMKNHWEDVLVRLREMM